MITQPQRGALNQAFENLNLQFQEVKTLLQAVTKQHEEVYFLGDQLSGINRLIGYLQKDLESVQSQADDLDAWAHVTYRRAMEGVK